MLLKKAGFLVLLLTLIQGCETVPVTNGVVVKAKTIVVLPVSSMYIEMENLDDGIQDYIVKAVKSEGFKVLVLRGEAYEKMCVEALSVSGSMYDPKRAKLLPLNPVIYTKALIDLLKENNNYDVVLMPELVLRTAVVQGDDALWDGVEREFTWKEHPKDTFIMPSKAQGLSLHLSAYTDRGAQVFHTYNGISLPYDLRLEKNKFQFDLKEHYFTRGEMKDAVKDALKLFKIQVKLNE